MYSFIESCYQYLQEVSASRSKKEPCPPIQFALFRTLFGLYLTFHFAFLIPYGPELFGENGMIPEPSLNPTWGLLPSFEGLFESDEAIQIFLISLTLVSISFAAGFCRRLCALFLWYGWSYLFNRNVLIANPGLPYVGWLLLACVLIPSGEGHYLWNPLKPGDRQWSMPPVIYWGAWFLMGVGYTISGLHKLQCPSWIDGSALRHVLSGLLGRDNWLRNLLLAMPPIVLQLNSWISLALEIAFLPLGLFDRLRLWFWLIFMVFHIGVTFLINFTDLTLGVLMIHLFTFDYRWLNIKKKNQN